MGENAWVCDPAFLESMLTTEEKSVLDFLSADERWDWRSVHGIEVKLGIPEAEVREILLRLEHMGFAIRWPKQDGFWGSYKKVKPQMDMSREERQPGEQELWDKAHPLPAQSTVVINPTTFQPEIRPGQKNQIMYDSIDDGYQEAYDKLCEGLESLQNSSSNDGGDVLPQHRRQHQQHMRGLIMDINNLPTSKIVHALSQAIAHAREVGLREHIKGDRVERVNQFIVSLRRHFSYMGDEYKTAREFLSAQLARKEVWYDIGVLNPASLTGFSGYSSLKQRDVEGWLAQAEAITPTTGDLKAAIERDLERIKGNLLVAQTCTQAAEEISRNADKVVAEMAALAESM